MTEIGEKGPHYRSLERFYTEAAPELRRYSREWDYGVHWHDGEVNWPLYRVTWFIASGELIAVCQGRHDTVEVLGRVPAVGTYPDESQSWEAFREKQTIERVLEGWEHLVMPQLDWIRERMPKDPA